jgi:hypothetical protein
LKEEILMFRRRILVPLFLVVVSQPILADTISIPANKDNTLFESATGSLSNGVGEWLFTGRTLQGAGLSLRRALVAFDVAGNVPAGSTINSATLTLNLQIPISGSQGTQTVTIRRVNADWGEGTSDSGSPGGQGITATPNDATWIHRFHNTINWASAGGDFEATSSASTSMTANGPYTLGSTSQMVADVQGWLDNPATSFGWMIRSNETAAGTAFRYGSRENANPAFRPVLTIDYTPPIETPAVSATGIALLALTLLGFGGLLAARHRAEHAVARA